MHYLVYLPLVNPPNSLICQNYEERIRPQYKTTRYNRQFANRHSPKQYQPIYLLLVNPLFYANLH